MSHTTVGPERIQIHVVLRGGVSASDSEYARAKVAAVTAKFHIPVLFARLKLTQGTASSGHRPALAQVNVEVNGRPVRAQVAAEGMREAVDLLVARLQSRLHHAVETRAALYNGERQATAPRDRTPGTGTAHRPDPLPEDRDVVRHKAYSAPTATPEDAVLEMELMDYDFHLFTDSATGQDTVVHRSGPHGHRLDRLDGTADTPPAPKLTLAEAKTRLDTGGAPFVFFADATTGRGNVLYRRFDGHYGLITPAGAAAPGGSVTE